MMDAPSSRTTRSPEDLERHALEAAFVAREPWAFEAAYTAYRRRLYGAAYGVLHDAGESEDCVHDVLVRLWRHGHAYTAARGSLEAFLVVCVRNEALSQRRRNANRERIVREQLQPADSPAPDDPAAQRIDLARTLARLSEPQQQAVRLAYYDGLTHEQIARRLGQPVGTVKSRLSNALKAMRTFLSQGDAP